MNGYPCIRNCFRIDFLIPVFSFFLLFASCQSQQSTNENQERDEYELVWSDEFEEEGAPNPDFWSHEEGFVRNRELQYYQPDNAEVKEGRLVIEGRREKVKNPAFEEGSSDWKKAREYSEYTASSIHTRGKKSFQYGRVEVRAKIDTALGMWPAIWTLGVEGGWPANGEIDIMEYYLIKGQPHILANAAWAHEEKRAAWDEATYHISHFTDQDPDWIDKFHVWKMDWTEEYIRIFLDDELLNEVDLSETINPDGVNPFQQPHYLLLNLAIGSNGGDPSSTDFPRRYEVEYVRVFQKKDKR
ncbi:glycoside hydrolase family 16 protein [Pleomorphovibrio marinus]|uniref:glycoside hydrolase family 16 protein n=1 Tax=Pleomorphovibrio marinus TaxID=2164132 RepID=UPI000E0A5B68|nr:glycoside hydrolase family 16 protein [Pleomorphovibrio marinus]